MLTMSDKNFGSMGFPDEYYGLPLMVRVKLIILGDMAAAEGAHMAGFAARQVASGLRQSFKPHFPHLPERHTGALVNKAS
jgi:hypothetical protein